MSRDPRSELHERYHALVSKVVRRLAASGKLRISVEDGVQYGHEGLAAAKRYYDSHQEPLPDFAVVAVSFVRHAVLEGQRREFGRRRGKSEALRHALSLEALQDLHTTDVHPLEASLDFLGDLAAARLHELAGDRTEFEGDAPDDVAYKHQLRAYALAEISALDPLESDLVRGHFYEDRELVEIGAEHKIRDPSYLTRVLHRALRRLREPLTRFISGSRRSR